MPNTETPEAPPPDTEPQPHALTRTSPIKRFQIGANVVLQIFFAAFIVLMINYLAFKRPPMRWDISRNTKFQLSPMTKKLLGTLQKPVKIVVFSAGSPIYPDLVTLLREY